jgi:hypothetical protein
VANGVCLQDAIFDVPMSLDGADSQFLWMGRNPNQRDTGNSRAGYLNLSHARIHRELHINDMQIGRLLANGLHVEGVADFEKLKIAQEFDFRHAQFKDLILSNIQWPDSDESRQSAGINFDSISPEAEGPADPASTAQSDPQWASLLAWVENSSYAPAAYQQLEAALKKEGHSELADGTYESMQKGATSHGSLGKQGQFKNFVSHWLIGYGREPQWAFYWSIPVVLFGWIVFRRREDVESRKGEDTIRPYDPMWYSLDLFLPLTTLQAADVWMPRQDSRFRRYYARVHSILGWILIPIGLAAISGLIAGK